MNNEKVDISVIMPAYNVEQYIAEALESVISQQENSIEVICVNDSSTDNTMHVLEEYMLKDKRIKTISHNCNMGASQSRKDGCDIANGKYIYFFDSDDVLVPNSLNKMFLIAEENELDVLTFSGEAFSDDNFIEGDFPKCDYSRKGNYSGIYTGPELFSNFIKNDDNTGNLVFQFIRRDFYVNNSLYNNCSLRFYDDSPFSIYMSAKRAMCISDVLYLRRYRNNSQMTEPLSEEKIESVVLGIYEDFLRWGKTDFDDEINEEIEKFFNRCFSDLRSYNEKFTNRSMKYVLLKKYPAAKYLYEYFVMGKSVYPTMSNKVIEDVIIDKNIVIFGAGKVANRIAESLERHGCWEYKVTVSCLEDNNTKFRGKMIYDINDENIKWAESTVIVAVSKKNQDEISKILEAIRPYKIVLPEWK